MQTILSAERLNAARTASGVTPTHITASMIRKVKEGDQDGGSDQLAAFRLALNELKNEIAGLSLSRTDAVTSGTRVISENRTPDAAQASRKRGRPIMIPDERKQRALGVTGGKARAQILYETKYPTAQQVKNVSAILRHYQGKRQLNHD